MSDLVKIKELRERTGTGLSDCKKALIESDWDIEAAIDYLRKQSSVKATKKADRNAAEGRLMASINDDASVGAIVEVNVETDFAARNERFVEFIKSVADGVLENGPDSLNDFEQARQELVQTLGENVSLRRAATLSGAPGTIVSYIHTNGTVGTLLEIKEGSDSINLDMAMHITAMSPLVVSADQLPASVVDKEREILLERARSAEDRKPDNIIERMVGGQLKKFESESCLLSQGFVRDPKVSVSKVLKDAKAEVLKFVRYQVGEATS